MAAWVWVVIAIVVVVVFAAIAAWLASRRRTRHLQHQFGPEYERTTQLAGGKREAEDELRAREKRRGKLDIRPLDPEARDRYAHRWQHVQEEFVDSPAGAVARADALVNSVMSDRGYPMDDFERRAADISVDHPGVVEHYRVAHHILVSMEDGDVTTEEERRAMQHYRSLFDELLSETPTREVTHG
jgi:hypothetical protein